MKGGIVILFMSFFYMILGFVFYLYFIGYFFTCYEIVISNQHDDAFSLLKAGGFFFMMGLTVSLLLLLISRNRRFDKCKQKLFFMGGYFFNFIILTIVLKGQGGALCHGILNLNYTFSLARNSVSLIWAIIPATILTLVSIGVFAKFFNRGDK